MTVALRKKTVKVTERDADGLVVSTEEIYEHDEPVAKAAVTDEDAALLADLRELARAEVVAKAAREAELVDEAAWINAHRAAYDAAGRQPDPALQGAELAVMEIEHVAAVRNPAHQQPGWLAIAKGADTGTASPDRVTTALGKDSGSPVTELTPERLAAMAAMTTDEWEQYLTIRVNQQPPAARAQIVKALRERAEPSTPERVEAVRKAVAGGGGVIGNEMHPDPTAPAITPPGVDAPNVLNGADPRYAMTTDNVERVRAVMEQHRHKATGQYRSPSRSAGEIQKAGPWSYAVGQNGATPKPTPGRIL